MLRLSQSIERIMKRFKYGYGMYGTYIIDGLHSQTRVEGDFHIEENTPKVDVDLYT